MAMTQLQLYELTRKREAEINEHFMTMVTNIDNPLTSADLRALVINYPERWGRFEQFIPILESREAR